MKHICRLFITLSFCFYVASAVGQTVDIPDSNLRAKIEVALGKASGATITIADMLTLTQLDASFANISNLTGLEHASNLTTLKLGANNISDISVVRGLTNLTELSLDGNNISDISVVRGLTNLTELSLDGNNISDISAIAGLTNLTTLYLNGSNISNISAVRGLTNLTWLFLGDNTISDISAVAGLTNLRALYLNDNNITDLSPLIGNAGLGTGDFVDVQANPLNSVSINTHIPTLQRRGVEVWFDEEVEQPVNVAPTVNIPDSNLRAKIESALGKAVGAAITTADMESLTRLDAQNVNINVLTGIEYATNLTGLYLYGNSISDISPLIGNTGLGGGDTVDMRANPLNSVSINTHIPNLQRRGVTVLFDAVVVPPVDTTPTVTIPDSNLRTAIETALGKASGAAITTADMESLTRLDAYSANIGNLTGLEYATNLRWLYLYENNIADISAVSGLTNLEWLMLNDNNISDLSPVTGLTNLTNLSLWVNNISDISAVRGLTNLTVLSLQGNNITDLSPLIGNTGLGGGDTVDMRANPLSSLSINTHIPTLQQRGVTVLFDEEVEQPVDTTPTEEVEQPVDTTPTEEVEQPVDTTPTVTIPDSKLRAKIESVLDKASGDTITTADMATLESLYANNANISVLTGLEHATNLTYLELGENTISDISAVRGLMNLTTLSLGLNNIRDISPVAGLTNLIWLYLGGNNVTDLSSLIGNTGLGDGDVVDVQRNPLNAVSINTHIPTLQRRGVTVLFDAVVVPPVDTTPTVDIPDRNLRAKIEAALGKASGDTITTADMETLTTLYASSANISNLTGLEHATNLVEQLDLWSNNISDISALSGLTNLTQLYIESNNISDISPLSGLTNLEWLSLSNNTISDLSALSGLTNLRGLPLSSNNISDISAVRGLTNLTRLRLDGNNISDTSALSGLTNLEWLSLSSNNISDLSAVRGLTKLTYLRLDGNNISDISALSGLTNLTGLYLWGNGISDISALVSNTGLGGGDEVDVRGNPLNAVSINTHIPTLQGRGVDVRFDAVVAQTVNIPDRNLRAKIESALGKASGDTITTANMATLTTLDARGPDIGMDGMMDDGMMDDGMGMADDMMDDGMMDDGMMDDGMGIADDMMDDGMMDDGMGMADDMMDDGMMDDGMMDDGMMDDGMGMADDMMDDGMMDDMGMAAPESYISNLAGLEHATNLTKLWLGGNTISDISVLSGLTNLEWLSLWGNNISDLSALSGLTNLEWLKLSSNNISDISVLSGLTNLTWLYLYGNTISDLSAVAGLTNLTALRLSNNNISDISSVRGLTNLTELYLYGNTISDLLPLVGNTGLGTGDEVDVTGNPLSSLSINTHIPTLQGRGVEVWFDEEVAQPVNTTPTVSVSPASVKSASIGDQLTFSLKIVNGQNVAGYQATVAFDTSALRYISSVNGDYLPTGAFFVPPSVSGNQVTLAAMTLAGEESNGDGTLATLTFEVVAVKAFTLTLSDESSLTVRVHRLKVGKKVGR